jgi:hypothetical protein
LPFFFTLYVLTVAGQMGAREFHTVYFASHVKIKPFFKTIPFKIELVSITISNQTFHLIMEHLNMYI